MSEEARSVKRRRIASQHDVPVASSTTKFRAQDAANGPKKSNGSDPATPTRKADRAGKSEVMERNNGTPSKKSTGKGARRIAQPPPSDDESDELGKQSSEESDGEPRRSARARKPSAKLLFIEKDITASQQSRLKEVENEVQQSATKHSAARQSKPASAKATPAKLERPAKSAQSTPSKTPKRRGRPPKDATPAEPKQDGAPLRVDNPFETPKKRGRPPGSTNKPKDSTQPVSTQKALKFDLPSARSNAIVQTEAVNFDIEMVDDMQELQDEKTATQQQVLASKTLKKFANQDFPVPALSKIVLEKLAQRRPIRLTHLDEEYAKVHTLLESTITAGEGNSMLVVGARGSGKSALVNQALSELTKAQKESFHVVRLSGFIQTDDKLALREIWRQLGREMETDEDVSKSYADTLTMLLALLSHPDEIAGAVVDRVAKSIIIVMDEFDLFATHARQTLLYNLLDIAQSRKAPIAVLGLTTKFDVTERLEKRVKSRFSHRYVHLPLPKSLKAFQDVCKAAMSIDAEELSFEEQMTLSQNIDATRNAQTTVTPRLNDCLEAWNASVNNLFLDDAFNRAYIRNVYHLTKSVSAVLTSLLMPLSSLPTFNAETCKSVMPVDHFLSYKGDDHLLAPDSSLAFILPSVSELQLSLLIAAARLEVIHDSDTCSFGMAYAQYVELSSKARLHSAAAGALATGAGSRVWGRDVARGEWEMLIKRGLLLPISEAGGSGAVTSIGGLVKVDVRLEEISGAVKGMSSIMERWCKQI